MARTIRTVADDIRDFNGALFASNPEFTREKLLRLAISSWWFFRGTDHLFFRDITSDKRLSLARWVTPGSRRMLIHGDLHIGNFGCFEDAEARVHFDLVDFDEAAVGPWIYDVARACTSIALAGRACKFDESDWEKAIRAFAKEYARSLGEFVSRRLHPDFGWTLKDAPEPIAEVLARAKGTTRKMHLDKRTERTKDGRRFTRGKKFFDVSRALRRSIEQSLAPYVLQKCRNRVLPDEFFNILDVARKEGGGVGSLGGEDFLVLIEGPTDDPDLDYILEIKEQHPAPAPSPDAYRTYPNPMARRALGLTGGAVKGKLPPSMGFPTAACRVVTVQRLMQSHPDRLLGEIAFGGRSYQVKEDSTAKSAADPTALGSIRRLIDFCEGVARLVAKGHYRQDRYSVFFPMERGIGARILHALGHPDRFSEAMVEFGMTMCKHVREQHHVYLESPLAKGEWK